MGAAPSDRDLSIPTIRIMNITELARNLRLSVDVTRHVIPRVGFDIGLKAIKVPDDIAQQIIERVSKNPLVVREVEEELGIKTVKVASVAAPVASKGPLSIPEQIAVRELAQLLQKPVTEIVSELMKNGIFANLNEDIDFETAAIIAEDLGFSAVRLEKTKEKVIQDKRIDELLMQDQRKEPRPPVVVIMGHVDHGKTKLLDTIRKSHVMESEAGGITQHIGAYQVAHNGKKITFIDTPGHEAFTAMRSRGANVADIAILVVAWDDGIMPQTKEAINIIKKQELPFIVAVTKMDKQGSSSDKVLKQLAELEYLPEQWGGSTIVIPISAQTEAGIEELLNMILLKTEMDQETIMADASRGAVGTVIESRMDKGEGPVATVIIQTGTLRPGDLITAGQVAGKVKALKDDFGKMISAAGPGTPVKILGLKDMPTVGDILQVTDNVKEMKQMMKTQKLRAKQLQDRRSRISSQIDSGSVSRNATYSIVLKTDNLGSQEAILESLEKLPKDFVRVDVVRKGLGNVNESDVAEAASAGAVIYGFHISLPPTTKEAAFTQKADVRMFDVIYALIEDIIKELESRIPPEISRTIEGMLKVSALFRQKGKTQIVGGLVTKGKAKNGVRTKIMRREMEIGIGTISEVRVGANKTAEVPMGTECGCRIDDAPLIQIGDVLEFFTETKRARKLLPS